MKTFTFNGQTAESFGLKVSGGGTYGSPARSQEAIEIPGRNGDLLIDGGRWDNIEISYPVYCIGLPEKREAIANWLTAPGYHRLYDDWNPDTFRLAFFTGAITWETFLARHGEASLTFSAKPQRFLFSGERPLTFEAAGILTNPTYYTARPLIRAYGTGSFTVNGTTVTITAADEYTDIDCELMDCYKGTTNRNESVELEEFPTLIAGDNSISLDGITQLVITPRWFVL